MTIQNAVVSRKYRDSATGGQTVVGVTVAYPERANKAGLLMELGAAFVDIIKQLTPDGSLEPEPFPFPSTGSVGGDIVALALLGSPEDDDEFKTEQGDDDTHG